MLQIAELYSGDYFIREYPDPILQQKATPIAEDEFGAELALFGEQMIEAMVRYAGIGLAAPQIGLSKRIFVMKFPHTTGDPLPPAIICNPVLELGGEGTYAIEGCLSLPGAEEQVHRSMEVFMTYQTPYGDERQMVLLGMEARIAQHETDHLDGILFFDRISRQPRRALLRKWEKRTKLRA